MNPFIIILSSIIYRPIFNLLIVFFAIFGGNLGLSIIALTLTVRFALLKTSLAQNKMQQQMTDIQPKLKEIEEKYKDKPEQMSAEMMKVLKTQGAGPLKGCLMALVQIPVFLGLFYVIQDFSNNHISSQSLYSFFDFFGHNFTDISNVNTHFLGMNLLQGSNTSTLILAVIGAVLIFAQMKLSMMNQPKPAMPAVGGQNMPDMGKMMGFMNIMMAVMMGTFIHQTPAGVGIYILTTTFFGLIQFAWQYRELIKVKLGLIKN